MNPQRTGGSRSAAEWKADPGLDNIIHGNNQPGSVVDRSFKAAPAPTATSEFHDHVASGGGSRGKKGGTGVGKGPLNPASSMPKNKSGLV